MKKTSVEAAAACISYRVVLIGSPPRASEVLGLIYAVRYCLRHWF